MLACAGMTEIGHICHSREERNPGALPELFEMLGEKVYCRNHAFVFENAEYF